ncbi:uncharacterized protein LOC130566350 [Triplophysa rosa]|nr:uncharacterized protein LOC130566350 [Triplophysa rosa]
MEDTSEKEKNTETEEKKEMSSLRKMPSVPEPIVVKEASDPPTPPVTDINALPSVGRPVMFNPVPPTSTLPTDEIRPVIRPQLSAGEPVRVSRRVHRTSRHLGPPAVEIRPLPAVEEPSLADRIFPASVGSDGMRTLPSVKEPLLVRQNAAPVTDEGISLTSSASFQSSEEQKLMIQVDHHSQILPRSDVKPTPDTLLFDSTSQVVLMDIDIENEYVKYTGRTFTRGEMKTTHHKALEAAMRPKAILCWMEIDSEVQEPVPPIQVDEVQDVTEEHQNRKITLFHINPSHRPKTETQQLKTQKKRNGPLVLFEWAKQKVSEKEEKKRRKEKMLLERQRLHERYLHDPKLKHLWINKHNRFNSSFHYEV